MIFECKNHQEPIQERDITEFSSKIGDIYGHATKGLIVSSSRLQSGAESYARNKRIGIVKFDVNGIEVIAERTIGAWAEHRFLQSQIFDGPRRSKSLKFSASWEGRLFDSFNQLLRSFEPDQASEGNDVIDKQIKSVPFVSDVAIRESAQEALVRVKYASGEVDLEKLCAELGLKLTYLERVIHDVDGNPILGSANFGKKLIEVNQHGNPHRERFTIAHEIGHFCLRHDQYLRSEFIVENDLFIDAGTDNTFNYERLEFQANLFASELLLPDEHFRREVEALRQRLDIYDKGFGYIFVDVQPCNYTPYNLLLSELSDHFGASNQVIEIRLETAGLVTDEREIKQPNSFHMGSRNTNHRT